MKIVLRLVGLDTITGEYHVNVYNSQLSEILTSYTTNNPVLVSSESVNRNSNRKILELQGSENLKTLFLAFDKVFNDNHQDAFPYGNNNQGRLAWMSVYRLQAIRELYEKTGDTRLRDRLTSPVLAMMNNADPDGLYFSTRYSRDKSTPVSWAVHTGLIYSELLKAKDYLNCKDRLSLIAQAETAWSNLEKDWDGEAYRFPLGQPINYDGIQLPWNQQGAVGLMASELYKVTGKPIYRERIEKLYNNFVNELEEVDGTPLWHYWPNEFYEGWNWGERISSNYPVRDSQTDELYEDYSHAYLTSIFVREASEVLGVESPINLEEIGNNLEIAPWSFSRFISGDVSHSEPSLNYIPSFIESENIAEYYREVIPSFHSSALAPVGLAPAYAKLVADEPGLGETLTIKEYSPGPEGVSLTSQYSFESYEEIVDYYFNRVNHLPTVNMLKPNANQNDPWLKAAEILSVTDQDNDEITQYRFWHPVDDRGYLHISGELTEAEGTITITNTDFLSTWIQKDLLMDNNRLWMQVYDGSDWSVWTPLNSNSI